MSGSWTLAVDFGTTSTVAAMGGDGASAEVLEVDGNRKMPSMVVVDEDGTVVVGIAAAGLARSMPQRTIRTPKDRLGDPVPIVVGGSPFQPVSFVTAVLEHVLADATRFQGSTPTYSRLTYPATWNRPKRARLLEAAVKAGFPAPELVAEPIAAALTYADAETLSVGDHVAVYDLGGGTFDTVVLLRTETGFAVVGRPLGDPQLGGELFDEILMNYVGEQIDPELWDQLLVSEETGWMRASARLRAECKRAKEALSLHPVAEVSVGLPGGMVDVSISREQLDELIRPFIDESIDLLARCLGDADQTGETISAIYMTGGASRMPLVEHALAAAFPQTVVSRRGDPKVAVALGALLAIPGSLDASLQQAPERTTVDDVPTPSPPPPPAPVVEVPSGPETEVAAPMVDVSSPETEVAAPAPPKPAAAPPMRAATPSPRVVQQSSPSPPQTQQRPVPQAPLPTPAVPSAAAPAPDPSSISPAVVLTSLFAVLIIAGGLGFFIINITGNDDPERDDVATISETTRDSDTTTTTAVRTPTTLPAEVASTEPVVVDGADFGSALLTTDDLGFGWEVFAGGVDETNRNLCNISNPSEPIDEAIVTYELVGRNEELTTEISLFETEVQAQLVSEFERTLASQCPNPELPFSADERLLGELVPLQAAGADGPVMITFPEASTSNGTIAYRLRLPSNASVRTHLLAANIQVGRSVGSLVLFTPGEPLERHIDFMNAMLETMAGKLEEVQQ